jgi:hypothetical protein
MFNLGYYRGGFGFWAITSEQTNEVQCSLRVKFGRRCRLRSLPLVSRGRTSVPSPGTSVQCQQATCSGLAGHERGRQLRRLLSVDRTVAESAVKVFAVLGFDNLKTGGNAVRSHSPRLAIGHRKLGSAGLAALRTPEIFNPMVAGCHHFTPSPETFLCRQGGTTRITKGPVAIGSNKTPSERGGIEAGQVGGVLTRASSGGAWAELRPVAFNR